MNSNILAYLQHYQHLGLTPIPLCAPKPEGSCLQHGTDCPHPGKRPLVRWRNGWNPTAEELEQRNSKGCNWGVRCGPELAAWDFDATGAFHRFLQVHPEVNSWPRTRTGRGFDLWVRPKKPVRSQRLDGVEVRCLGSYIVAPPSIHPTGTPYTFEIAPKGVLPEIDLEELLCPGRIDSSANLGGYESIRHAAPSDFALRYGKSAYPQTMQVVESLEAESWVDFDR